MIRAPVGSRAAAALRWSCPLAEFCQVTEFAIVCPITSRIRPFGTSVVLPPGLLVSGEILTSHVRSIDTLARPISYAEAAVPAEILHDVRMKLAALIGL